MRITILDTGDPASVSGGTSAFIRNVIPRLDGDVRVIGLASETGHVRTWQARTFAQSSYSFLSVAHDAGVSRRPVVPNRLRALIGVLRLRSEVLEDADVLYAHSVDMVLPLLLRRVQVPIVFHMHGASNPLLNSRYGWARIGPLVYFYERLFRTVVRHCRLVISVDTDGLRRCRSILTAPAGERCVLVPTCFDEWVFHVDSEPGRPDATGTSRVKKQVIFVGRLEEGKGTDVLLASFALLAERRDDVTFMIVGDGTQRAKMEALSRSLGIQEETYFSGWAEPEAVADLLRASDVYFLPSVAEGLPIAVLESLACGTPVVATPVGDLSRIIQDGANGFLVSAPSAEGFSKVLEQALDHFWDKPTIAGSVESMTSGNVAKHISAILRAAAGIGTP